MLPEQAAGNVAELECPAMCMPSGAVLYQLLTGRPPFLADTVPETLLQVQTEEPVPPSQRNPASRALFWKSFAFSNACRRILRIV